MCALGAGRGARGGRRCAGGAGAGLDLGLGEGAVSEGVVLGDLHVRLALVDLPAARRLIREPLRFLVASPLRLPALASAAPRVRAPVLQRAGPRRAGARAHAKDTPTRPNLRPAQAGLAAGGRPDDGGGPAHTSAAMAVRSRGCRACSACSR